MHRLVMLFLLLISACQAPTPTNSGWQKVYQNNPEGLSTFGDKKALIEAVRLGYPIRIGWGSNRVEHVADAGFLTIFEGTEVFAQINTITGQSPRIDGDSLKIRFRLQNQWTKMVGTNGYATAFMTDKSKAPIEGESTDRYSATTWYVLYPNHMLDIEPRPLWRKESPNWEKWNNTASN